jgi:hypothetical protein
MLQSWALAEWRSVAVILITAPLLLLLLLLLLNKSVFVPGTNC